jgi:hypothetical protein
LIRKCREACNELGFGITSIAIDKLVEMIKTHLEGKKEFQLDFIEYMVRKTAEMSEGTAQLYNTMVNALKRYIKRDAISN